MRGWSVSGQSALPLLPLWHKNTFVSSESNATALGRNGTTFRLEGGFASSQLYINDEFFGRPRARQRLTVTSLSYI